MLEWLVGASCTRCGVKIVGEGQELIAIGTRQGPFCPRCFGVLSETEHGTAAGSRLGSMGVRESSHLLALPRLPEGARGPRSYSTRALLVGAVLLVSAYGYFVDRDVWLHSLPLLSMAALTLTVVLAWRTRRFLARAARVDGRVTRIAMDLHHGPRYGSEPPDTTERYTPYVEFSLEDGSPVEFRSCQSTSNAPGFKEGEIVTVVYERAHPLTTAEIAGSAVWRSVTLSGLGTFLLLLVTILWKAC